LGKIGNVFHTKDIEAAIENYRKYNPDIIVPFTSTSMGIDPAYGSPAFGIVVTQFVDGLVQILHAEEYRRPDYNEMLSNVYGLMSKYDVDKVYIDGANPSFIKSLKLQIGEDADYDKVIARYKSDGLGDNWSLLLLMQISLRLLDHGLIQKERWDFSKQNLESGFHLLPLIFLVEISPCESDELWLHILVQLFLLRLLLLKMYLTSLHSLTS
jgi:hypothetical protein